MLLLFSSQSFCQTTTTKSINCYSDAQINQIFKGLKQNDYLKLRLGQTEKTLKDADNVISAQKETIIKNQQIVSEQKNLIAANQFKCEKDLELKDSEITRLNETLELQKKIAKKDSRKKFWNGVKIGGVSVAILGAVGVIFLK